MNYRSLNKDRIYHRYYSNLRGVDFSAEKTNANSYFEDLENMWRDPRGEGNAIERYPGFRVLTRFSAPVLDIFRHRVNGEDFAVVHAGTSLYRFPAALKDHPETLASLAPLPISVAAEKGCAFSSYNKLYLLIGGAFLCIDSDGSVGVLGEEGYEGYEPITYYNGEAYEQRNLLSDKVRHVFTLTEGALQKDSYDDRLRFTVVDEVNQYASVSLPAFWRDACILTVPETCIIDGKTYTVVSVAAGGFQNMTSLISITLPATVSTIGDRAFAGCTALLSFSSSSGLLVFGKQAFYGCLSLSTFFLNKKALHLGEGIFDLCPSLDTFLYEGTEEEFSHVALNGSETFIRDILTVSCNADPIEEQTGIFRFALCEEAEEILGVTLDGEKIYTANNTPYEGGILRFRSITDGKYITHVELICSDRRLVIGRQISARLRLSHASFSTPKGYVAFGTAHPEITGINALCGCRAVCEYDGRIFFTANPALPNTVFHSLPDESGINNPFYVGTLSYFNDSFGGVPNRALLSTGDALIVLKGDEDGFGALFYHTAESTNVPFIPRVYPTSSGVAGVGAFGCALNFRDDAVFLAKDGLLAVDKETLDRERDLKNRSFPVGARLCKEDFTKACAAVFEGILYLLIEGRIYLADSSRYSYRSDGKTGYEWFCLNGVGSYTDDRPLYRTTPYLSEFAAARGIECAPIIGKAVTGEVFSVGEEDGTLSYYEKAENGKLYAVDCNGERTGGVFSPAVTLCTFFDMLLFGTNDGSLCCMNTDKRGKRLFRLKASPYYVKNGSSFLPLSGKASCLVAEDSVARETVYQRDGNKYTAIGESAVYRDGGKAYGAEALGEEVKNSEIHSYFYTYAAHAYTAACTFCADDGDIPHRRKDTVSGSAAVRVKTQSGSAFSVLVRTDKHPFYLLETLSASGVDFGNLDFGVLDFSEENGKTLPLREKERGWCIKQYRFASTEAFRPFGIYGLSYSYRTSGNIRYQ